MFGNLPCDKAEKRGADPMKALIIYAHPNPRSFNASILKVVLDELRGKRINFISQQEREAILGEVRQTIRAEV